jgi:spermidine/putrescine transport system permease protein
MTRQRGFGWLGLYAIFFVILLYGPVLLLPLFSFNNSIYIVFPLKDFTTRWYAEMAGNPALIAALRTSVKLGLIVAFISTVFGLLAARAVTRYNIRAKRSIIGLIMLPLVVPSLTLGIALLVTLRMGLSVNLSLWTIGAGHVLICLPFAMMVLIARLEGFDRSLEEASLDLGESEWTTFWRVTFPLALPGIVASFLLSFTVSLDEFVLAFFLGGDDATLPLFIWSQLRFPAKLPGVLALGSCILAFSFVMVIVADIVRRRGLPSAKSSES